jgi:hypothetical protein
MRETAIIDTYLDQTLTSPYGAPVPESVGYVFGTATPQGPTDWEQLHLVQRKWLESLTKLGVDASPGYAIGAIQSWVEPVIFAAGVNEQSAEAIAADCRLEYYLALREGAVEVLDRRGNLCGRGPLRTPEATGVCVMPNNDPGEICVMRGGPYGSRAIAAAADWAEERTRLIAALGCGTCEQGKVFRFGPERKVFSGGGPISLVGHPVVTRYTAILEVSNA